MSNTTKHLFITGAAQGIGRETARLFAAQGWRVAVADRDAAGLASLAGELGSAACLPLTLDVTQPAQVAAALSACGEWSGGRLDLLINNAGILAMGPNRDLSLETQHRIVDVNLGGVLSAVHHALPLLRATPGARILSVASASALYGIPELAVYSATKAALKSLTESLSLELEPLGILVSDVLPPYVATGLLNGPGPQAASVAKMGVSLTAGDVAQVLWQAAQGRRLHWFMTPKVKALNVIFNLFPFARRSLVKLLAT
ncbi:MAG: SDR family oxidoreductase [Deltaproteobacteria bacterium]|nr:SDR family oxidoreductase [Deltaproteobacteria bacterium]